MPDGNFCVHCKTEDEAMALLNYLVDAGFRWADGATPTRRTFWERRQSGLGLWYYVDMSCPGYEITFGRYGLNGTKYRQVQLDDLIGQRNAEISVNSICDFV